MKQVLVALALVAASAAPAFAFRAMNGLEVKPAGDSAFLVDFGNTRHKTDYLCAAADYVSRGLGMSSTTRIYRQSPAPRGSGQGITFTLDPAAMVPMKLYTVLISDNTDGGISAAAARSDFCHMNGSFWR
ncbi:MAG: hypothetical protein ACRCS0_13835 [Albidovulum sp.]